VAVIITVATFCAASLAADDDASRGQLRSPSVPRMVSKKVGDRTDFGILGRMTGKRQFTGSSVRLVATKRPSGKFEGGFQGTEDSVRGERHCISAVAFMVAGGGFEPPTFGLCDLTHLSVRVGLCLHPRGVVAIQSLRLPPPFRPWAHGQIKADSSVVRRY
jgi:hypothetical protein